ncbi:MAG: hypothetical protein AB7G37_06320 [Solirubrobacteraceae bacterium]
MIGLAFAVALLAAALGGMIAWTALTTAGRKDQALAAATAAATDAQAILATLATGRHAIVADLLAHLQAEAAEHRAERLELMRHVAGRTPAETVALTRAAAQHAQATYASFEAGEAARRRFLDEAETDDSLADHLAQLGYDNLVPEGMAGR